MSPASKEEIQAVVDETRRIASQPPHPSSGEHQLPPEMKEAHISERSWVSLGLVITIAVLVATVAGSLVKGSAMADTVDQHGKSIKDVEAKTADLKTQAELTNLRFEQILTALNEVKQELKKGK